MRRGKTRTLGVIVNAREIARKWNLDPIDEELLRLYIAREITFHNALLRAKSATALRQAIKYDTFPFPRLDEEGDSGVVAGSKEPKKPSGPGRHAKQDEESS
jgi:hypothetical protein